MRLADAPSFFDFFAEANSLEEDRQNKFPADPKRMRNPGIHACLRGLWRGRAAALEEKRKKPKAS